MAVLNTVHHPNIVSVYACLTDMVEVAGALPAGRMEQAQAERSRGSVQDPLASACAFQALLPPPA